MIYDTKIASARGNAPDLQNIDRAVGGLPQISSSGFHTPPEVLGQVEDTVSGSTQSNLSTQNSVSTPKKIGRAHV